MLIILAYACSGHAEVPSKACDMHLATEASVNTGLESMVWTTRICGTYTSIVGGSRLAPGGAYCEWASEPTGRY